MKKFLFHDRHVYIIMQTNYMIILCKPTSYLVKLAKLSFINTSSVHTLNNFTLLWFHKNVQLYNIMTYHYCNNDVYYTFSLVIHFGRKVVTLFVFISICVKQIKIGADPGSPGVK